MDESRAVRSVRSASVALVALATVALSGCAAAPASLGGAAVAAVSVSSTLNQKPAVDFPTPLVAKSTQCEVVTPGSGRTVENGQLLSTELSIYNGATGSLIQETSFNGQNLQSIVVSDKLLPGLRQGLKCASEGARIVMVIPPADAFGDKGNAQWNLGPKDSLVVVIDVKRAYLARATGTPQLSQDGMPMVVLA
ncbi:MAG: FKBP-type peptidyl-prolyl cis-trans isomerase, partial [Agromyces sp.]